MDKLIGKRGKNYGGKIPTLSHGKPCGTSVGELKKKKKKEKGKRNNESECKFAYYCINTLYLCMY